jgi:hypothetical protein
MRTLEILSACSISTEWRVGRRFGIAANIGLGAFQSGTVGQLGLRAPFYATGSFDGGLQMGGKFVVGGRDVSFEWVPRGLTVQGGLLLGYHHLAGAHGYPPHPLATRTHDGFLPQIYADIGWSF